MAANITIYCLENITDYFEFERLCHDLMTLEGYASIEPLGGFSDKGRDAVHVDYSGRATVFAYSVREDWRAKLAEDAGKIHKHKHVCDQLVFITTARFTAGERDEAVASMRDEFNWVLQLYGVERLRVLLDVNHPRIKEAHPQIFPPDLLRLSTSTEPPLERTHLLISFVPKDNSFAEWLARKLTAEGYLVWCERFKQLGGESYPDDVDEAIKNRTFRVLGLYSQASLKNPEVMRQRTLALTLKDERTGDFLLPLNVDGVDPQQLDRVTSSLKFITFEDDWAGGLRQLLEKLESIRTPKLLPDGRGAAASAFLEKDVLTGQTETLYSNCFQIEHIPAVIHRFKTQRAVPDVITETLQHEWAYRALDAKSFLSFYHPPASFVTEYQARLVGGESWSDVEKVDGIWSRDLVIELSRKSLIVKCHEKGLLHCPETFLRYFPTGLVKSDRLYFSRPDGSMTFVNSAGQRKYWKPTGSEEYRYYLAPVFSVSQNLFDDFIVLVRVRVRFTNTNNEVLPKRKGVSRRKHLCANWWNNDWFSRTLAVSQYISDDGKIVIGSLQKEQLVINAMPMSLMASEGINESALDQLSFGRSELLAALSEDDTDEDAEEEKTNND